MDPVPAVVEAAAGLGTGEMDLGAGDLDLLGRIVLRFVDLLPSS